MSISSLITENGINLVGK